MTRETKAPTTQRRERWLKTSLGAVAFGVMVASGGAQAGVCVPDNPYDVMVASFHQSLALRTDGGWAGWGQSMKAGMTGVGSDTNAYVPLDITSKAFGDMGEPLLMTSASATNNEQTIALTDKGLYVWGNTGGNDNVLFANSYLASNIQGGQPSKVKGGGQDDNPSAEYGLPPGVEPTDVSMMTASWGVLAIVTKAGEAWVLGTKPLVGTLLGDGSTGGASSKWHIVKTPDGAPLQGVKAVRVQNAGTASSGALMAHVVDSTDTHKLYVWGNGANFELKNTANPNLAYAQEMKLPPLKEGETIQQIGVTGNSSKGNSFFVLTSGTADEKGGTLWSVGQNDQRQLGQGNDSSAAVTSWAKVRIGTGADDTLEGRVKQFSVQEHEKAYSGAAGLLIADMTDAQGNGNRGQVYSWGSNNGDMIARRGQGDGSASWTVSGTGTNNYGGNYHVGIPNEYISFNHADSTVTDATNNNSNKQLFETEAKWVEMGGHTGIVLPAESPQFCYVGHRTAGSMGSGYKGTGDYPQAFNCTATPIMNICGASGFDYGDAPKIYENGGGSNQAMHFYREGGDNGGVWLGELRPLENDASPKNVVSGTDNTGAFGDTAEDGTREEDGIVGVSWVVDGATNEANIVHGVIDGDIPVNASSVTLKVKVSRGGNGPATAYLHGWVDWDNNGQFDTGEHKTQSVTFGASEYEEVSLTWDTSAADFLKDGFRYVRLRVTTANESTAGSGKFPATNVTPRTDEDKKALGFAQDGEIEDWRVRVYDPSVLPNIPPVAVDVTSDPVACSAQPVKLSALLHGYDQDGEVVSYRLMPPGVSNGSLFFMEGSTSVLVEIPDAGLPIEADTELWYSYSCDDDEEARNADATFTFKAIDNDGDESADAATSCPVSGTGAVAECLDKREDKDAIYTIPKHWVMAGDDSVVTYPGQVVNVPVVENDKGRVPGDDNPALGVPSVVTQPPAGEGTVTCDASGCSYDPDGFVGETTFKYQVCLVDDPTVCDTATVTVTVEPTIAAADNSDWTQPDVAKKTSVLANDLANGIAATKDNVNISAVTNPGNGTATANADGTITYTPNAGFTGTDTYTYTICLQNAPTVCDTATVTIVVPAEGATPSPLVVAEPDLDGTQPGTPVTTNVVGNDSGLLGEPDPATVTVKEPPSNGQVTENSDGTITYTPNPGFVGVDTYEYEVCLKAPNGSVCDRTTVTITVTDGTTPEAPPAIVVAPDSDSTQPEASVTTVVLGNDKAVVGELDPASVKQVRAPGNGSITVKSDGTITYTPEEGFTGVDTYEYEVCLKEPNASVCEQTTVTITVGNPAIDAVDDPAKITSGNKVDIPILDNDEPTAGELDPASVSVVTGPSKGTVEVKLDGSVTYTAGPAFDGNDTFTYEVCLKDAPAICDTAVVTITADPHVFVVVTPPTGLNIPGEPVHGKVTCTSDGVITAPGAYCEIPQPPGVTEWQVTSCTYKGNDLAVTDGKSAAVDLPVGDEIICEYSYIVPGTPENPGEPVTPGGNSGCTAGAGCGEQDDKTIVPNKPGDPHVSIVVTPPTGPIVPGTPVTGTVVCTSDGDVAAENVACEVERPRNIPEDKWAYSCTPVTPKDVLEVGETIVCKYTYTPPTAPVRVDGKSSCEVDASCGDEDGKVLVPGQPGQPHITTVVTPPTDPLIPGKTVNGFVTCTSDGAIAAPNATCEVPRPPQVPEDMWKTPVCTPAQPVSSLAVNSPIVCEYEYTVPQEPVKVEGYGRCEAANCDSDDAKILVPPVINVAGDLQITKTLYEGHDNGAQCGTPAATDQLLIVEKEPTTHNLTWCFEVVNTGDSYLGAPVWDDSAYPGMDAKLLQPASLPLAAGATGLWYFEAAHARSVVNTVSLEMPVTDKHGNEIPNVDPATDVSEGRATFGMIYDPPYGLKVGNNAGFNTIEWTMVWVNDNVVAANGVTVGDDLQGTYVNGSLKCIAENDTVVVNDSCDEVNAVSNNGKRIDVVANFGPDFGNTVTTAKNRLFITFQMKVPAGTTEVQNQAEASWTPEGGEKLQGKTGNIAGLEIDLTDPDNPVITPPPGVDPNNPDGPLGHPDPDAPEKDRPQPTPVTPLPVPAPVAVPVDNPFALLLLALGLLGLGSRYARKRVA